MKKILTIFTFLMCLSLPNLAHAQFLHTLSGTTNTLTCTATSGTNYSTDIFYQTLTGNTIVTLPAAGIGCLNRDHIEVAITQGTNQNFTFGVNVGVGTAPNTLTNAGSVLKIGASSGGATNVTLRQIFVYDSTPAIPEWHLVAQETAPASAPPIVVSSAAQVGLSAGTAQLLTGANGYFQIQLTGNSGTISLGCPTITSKSSKITLKVLQDSSGAHPLLWDDSGSTSGSCPVIFYSGAPGATTDDAPYYNANSTSIWQFDFDPTDLSWHRSARSTMEGANLAGAGVNVGPHSPPGNLAFFYNTPALILNPGQCIQVSGDNAGNPQGASNYIYFVWAASQICNNGSTAGLMSFKQAVSPSPGTATDLPMSEPQLVQPNQCVWVEANLELQNGSPVGSGGTQIWGQDSNCVNVSQAGFNVTMTGYMNMSVGSF